MSVFRWSEWGARKLRRVGAPLSFHRFEVNEMRTETRAYKGYELTATQNYPKWDVGIYPSSPQLPWPNANFQFFSDLDVQKAFEKAERAVDKLLGVERPLV
jgi:hypothetical protein